MAPGPPAPGFAGPEISPINDHKGKFNDIMYCIVLYCIALL